MKPRLFWLYVLELMDYKAKYCPQCGIVTFSKYCSDCGTKTIFMPRCHVCKHQISSALLDDYCPHCGTKINKDQEPWITLEKKRAKDKEVAK